MTLKIVNSFLATPFPQPAYPVFCPSHVFHPYPSSPSLTFWGHIPPKSVWTCSCCLCGRISAETFHVCPGEFQLKQEQRSSCGQDALVHCLPERQGGSSRMAANRLMSSIWFNLSSLEGETCLFKFTKKIFTKDF